MSPLERREAHTAASRLREVASRTGDADDRAGLEAVARWLEHVAGPDVARRVSRAMVQRAGARGGPGQPLSSRSGTKATSDPSEAGNALTGAARGVDGGAP